MPGPVMAFSQPTASGDLFAWVEFTIDRRNPLLLCRLDPATGECPAIEVSTRVVDTTPRLSGRRLVWDAAVGDEAADVYFCEYDRVLEVCPVQRLTAELSYQVGSEIDGDRVVWSDARDGGARIYGRTLPRMRPLEDRTLRVGERLRVRVSAVEGSGEPIAIDAALAGEEPLAPGMRLRPLPSRPRPRAQRARLAPRPGGRRRARRDFRRPQRERPLHAPEHAGRGRAREPAADRARHGAALRRARRAPRPSTRVAAPDPDGDALRFEWRDARGRLLGRDCRVEVSAQAPGVATYRVFVSDGLAVRQRRVMVVWLPDWRVSRWWWWIAWLAGPLANRAGEAPDEPNLATSP